MRYALCAALLFALTACGVGLGLTPEAADAVVAETMAKLTPIVGSVFESHDLPPEVSAQFLAAMKTALEGLLTGGANWLEILRDVAAGLGGILFTWITGKNTRGFGLGLLASKLAGLLKKKEAS